MVMRCASAVSCGGRFTLERAPSVARAHTVTGWKSGMISARRARVPRLLDVGTGRRVHSADRVASFASSAAVDDDPPPGPPTDEDVEAATRKWLDETVIGLNLCPFARAPRNQGGVAIKVSRATTPDDLLAEFTAEAKRLAKTYTDADVAYGEEDDDEEGAEEGADGLSEPTTTLLVAPNIHEMSDDFILFLAIVERCEEILDSLDLVGYIQLATFHPHYQFEGEEVADPGSYTNRSPYPVVHLLRAVDVSRAVDAHPDTETIPSENVEKLRTIGREQLYNNLQTLTQLRVDSGENTSDRADRLARAKAAVEKAAAGDAIAKSLFETTEVDRAKSQVLRFLNYKPRTRSELRTKLIDDKLYDPDVADEALDLLQEAGVQSDVDYAEQFGRMKWRTSKWAPAQIRTELKRKGMDERDAREGLSRVFGDDVNAVGESGGYVRRGTVFEVRQEARAMGTESADDDKSYELFLASRKRWALTDGMDSEKRRRRLIGWLQRRGHAFSLIQRIVDSLEAEDERAKYE